MQGARRGDVLGFRFDPNVRVRTVSTQNTAGDHVKESSQNQHQKQQQQANIEQETNEMFVMHHRIVLRYFEMLADIIEKKDGYKNFYEQFRKFLERAVYKDSTN